MKPPRCLRLLSQAVTLAALLSSGSAAFAYDYPTSDRVIFVQDCMRQHPGPEFEMLSKCSCAIDALARKVPLDDFVAMSTASNANTIGGERGNSIRDSPSLQKDIKRFRELKATAYKGCFIDLDPPGR